MPFNPLEYLEQGKVDFIYNLTDYDAKNLISSIRSSKRRKKIIDSFLPKLKETMPYFCLDVIYDMEEYKDMAANLIEICYQGRIFEKRYLVNLLNNSSLGLEYLEHNFNRILTTYQRDLDFIFEYLFANFDRCKYLLNKLSIYDNLHIRFLFMNYLVKHHKKKISIFYDDITKYLSSITNKEYEQLTFLPTLMDMKDISELANTFFEANDYNFYQKFKKFILENYKFNNLGTHLITPRQLNNGLFVLVKNEEGIKEFEKDADTYFKTVATNRLQILKKYSRRISVELLEAYKRQLEYFKVGGNVDSYYENLDIYGLTRLLDEYVTKYLDLSNDKSHEYITKGSTASCYRIGDFAFKLVYTKWSYEDIICPDIYLILPNLEEVLIRNSRGVVNAGIEVQKYLKRSARNVPDYVFTEFNNELKRLGYFLTDTLIGGECGDNTRLLDDYREVSVEVPEWFKKYPLVLVDRDRIYESDKLTIKQLHTDY